MAYDPAPQANAMAALRFDPQMNAINRQIEDLKAQTLSNNTGIDTYSTEGNTGINTSYDTLVGQHAKLADTSNAQLHSVGDQIGQTWKDANALQQTNQDTTNKYLSDYATKFGLGEAGSAAMSALDKQIQGMMSRNSDAGATQQGAMTGWMGAQKQMMDNWAGIDQATRAKQLGDFTTAIANARAANNLQGMRGQNELYGKLNDTMGQRNSFLTDEMNQLVQADWDREFKTSQAKFQADVENAKLAQQAQQSARDESLGWATLMQGGIKDEAARLLGQQAANTADYTAHLPKEKPFNDLQTAEFVYKVASQNGSRTPSAANLEDAWNQAKASGAADGLNPYSPAAQKERDDAAAKNAGGGGFSLRGSWDPIPQSWSNSAYNNVTKPIARDLKKDFSWLWGG